MFSSFENDTVYKIGDSFTMRNILNIVDKMNATIPYHEFEPECISEGGICVKGYEPGKEYKSIRLRFENWPWISRGIKEEDLERKLIPCDFTGKERLFRTTGVTMVHPNGRKMKWNTLTGFSVKRE